MCKHFTKPIAKQVKCRARWMLTNQGNSLDLGQVTELMTIFELSGRISHLRKTWKYIFRSAWRWGFSTKVSCLTRLSENVNTDKTNWRLTYYAMKKSVLGCVKKKIETKRNRRRTPTRSLDDLKRNHTNWSQAAQYSFVKILTGG